MKKTSFIASQIALLWAVSLIAHAQNPPISIAYQLTHSENVDLSPSPDGREFVYIAVIAGKEQLFRMGIDGTKPMQLTHDDADHEDPAWSPDGKRIVFVLIKNELKQIHLMNIDGSGVEPLTPKEVKTIHPSWSPDSRSVIYCTDDDLNPPKKNSSEIDSIDLTSRRITTLISGGVNTFPVLSPDGKRIVFRRMLGDNSEVFVANSNGSDARNLTNNPAFDGWPAWSPDGTKIAFASNRNRSYEIYIMNPDGSKVQKIANTEGRATSPKWSPDGKTVYFSNCWKVDFSFDCQVYAAKIDAFQ